VAPTAGNGWGCGPITYHRGALGNVLWEGYDNMDQQKERTMKRKIILLLVGMGIMFVTVSQSIAHNIWINPGNAFPQVGETVDIAIGWGHTYTASRVDQEMKAGMFDDIQALDPDGQKVKLEKVSEKLYRLKIEKEGAYVITAGIKPGVFTMTPKGRQWSDKKGVEKAISCTSFRIEAKSLMVAGKKDQNLTTSTGQELEIIPLSNPATLKAGDNFHIMVTFKGKPAPGIAVNATYAGYSDGEKATDIAPHGGGNRGKTSHFPASTVTDNDGKAVIPLSRAGWWMIVISHKSPYPDKETCDQYMHNMAFTFEIK